MVNTDSSLCWRTWTIAGCRRKGNLWSPLTELYLYPFFFFYIKKCHRASNIYPGMSNFMSVCFPLLGDCPILAAPSQHCGRTVSISVPSCRGFEQASISYHNPIVVLCRPVSLSALAEREKNAASCLVCPTSASFSLYRLPLTCSYVNFDPT